MLHTGDSVNFRCLLSSLLRGTLGEILTMADNLDEDDDIPQLSADTLKILQQFYDEQSALHDKQIGNPDIMPQEDWQLSQFWYNDSTAFKLAEEAKYVAGENGRMAFLSAPTAFKKLLEISPSSDAVLLEYDKRFAIHGDKYIFYDYKNPLDIPRDLEKAFDIVVVDPPFLSERCLKNTAETVKFIWKGKVILCTGEIMEEYVKKYLGAEVCSFMPQHERNLANEFRCYTNYKTVVLEQT
ncbi:EEF1A lysine methyltransferase 1 [Lingula anatina]|uniref:Protein-lysine N-methyltransferase LOC106163496 n=1 Tax=Lingula anatina TaxID=7574 RepID=A0A1S3IFC0_LINAN|nr:EEF1A lysine methyltransferase 1 [Lingula anatina]|eukprot:XP_013396551.1 EEF1A lysine methyltransferase 1 [Lingula anatina]